MYKPNDNKTKLPFCRFKLLDNKFCLRKVFLWTNHERERMRERWTKRERKKESKRKKR